MAKWEELAASKRRQLADSIPEEWRIPKDKLPPEEQASVVDWPKSSGFFTSHELEITEVTATAVLEKLRSREWTSEEVTLAFLKRAAVAQQLTNCLSEFFPSRALSTARSLDAHLAATGRPLGPLHGLPISLKDNFQLTGLDSTDGFASWIDQPASSNSALVDLLLSLGAVPYVKTNVPTAMMIAETVNNVFGRTLNPLNRKLTSGGSSGGESALIAFKGSCLGVGTDIGGSLRIPAACTGIYTVRPSAGRFPTGGAKSGLAGQEAVRSVLGPMARSLEDVALWARAVVGAEPWRVDPLCLPVPWREVETRRGKIGVMWDDGIVRPTPPVQRALKETVEKLKKAGYEIVDWAPELHKELYEVLGEFFVADGGKTLRTIFEPTQEPFRPELAAYEQATELGVSQLWKLQTKRLQLITAYLERWQRAGIDAMLCPTTPYATVEHGNFKCVSYTGVFNVLDYSATSFPSGLYANEEVDRLSDQAVLSELDAQTKKDYDAAAVHGMPISLQLVAQRLEEERVLAMTRDIVRLL
ncbi:Fatty-acid amide hydrolase 1 [Sphaceloma murrayae]|uniref:amidase n=1 Tax=Sphaceloma murrayae TaxID=2082308 RepID=A0A2K1QHI4_9PEZI|nr:Fatty-acid amide hydrolase 1 [Sphaceloma murrayae]